MTVTFLFYVSTGHVITLVADELRLTVPSPLYVYVKVFPLIVITFSNITFPLDNDNVSLISSSVSGLLVSKQ